MFKIISYLLIPIAMFQLGCASPAARINATSKAVNIAEDKNDVAQIDRLAASIKDTDLTAQQLSGYSDETLQSLYDAVDKMAFYLPDNKDYTYRLETVFNEKIRRGQYENADIENMYSAFCEARMFDKAAALKIQFPAVSLPTLPEIVSSASIAEAAPWQVYEISQDRKTATLKVLPLDKGAHIVTVVFAGCGMSKIANKDIQADSELSKIFNANAVIVTRRFDMEGAAMLKDIFSSAPVYIMHKSGDFPGIWAQTSPNFYFLKDGKILYNFKAWSIDNPAASLNNLRKGMQSIGLLPPEPNKTTDDIKR